MSQELSVEAVFVDGDGGTVGPEFGFLVVEGLFERGKRFREERNHIPMKSQEFRMLRRQLQVKQTISIRNIRHLLRLIMLRLQLKQRLMTLTHRRSLRCIQILHPVNQFDYIVTVIVRSRSLHDPLPLQKHALHTEGQLINVAFEVEFLLGLGVVETLPLPVLHFRGAVHVGVENFGADGDLAERAEDLGAAEVAEN